MFLCLQMHSYPILGCFEHLRSQEAPLILALIPKIDDFLVLRLMRQLEAQTCDTNVIFLMPNRSHIKYMKKSMIHYGGVDGGGAMYVMIYVKVKFLHLDFDVKI